MRSTVGEAARWTIKEEEGRGLRKRLWEDPPSRAGSSGPQAPKDDDSAEEAA